MKKSWSLAVAGAVIASSLTGCANSSTGPYNGPHTQNAVYQKPPVTKSSMAHDHNAFTQGSNAYQYRNGYTVNGFNQNMAEQLTRVSDDVPGVDRATVVVNGRDAVIGIRVRQNLASEQGKVIEQQVHSAARAVSPSMNIRVTSDPAMFMRILDINAAIYDEAQHRTKVHNVTDSVADNASMTVNDFGILLKDLGRTVTAPFR